jgi:hypothetical protein
MRDNRRPFFAQHEMAAPAASTVNVSLLKRLVKYRDRGGREIGRKYVSAGKRLPGISAFALENERAGLHCRHPTINDQVNSSDVARGVGREEDDCFGDFIRIAYSPERYLHGHFCSEPLDAVLIH